MPKGVYKHPSAEERFFAKIERGKTDEFCWLWTSAISENGYGLFWDGRTVYAHRYIYQLAVGEIPEGLQIDHLCRIKRCANPKHLEAVSRKESPNLGRGKRVRREGKTHCKRGHAYDEANTYTSPRGRRSCRECGKLRHKAGYVSKKKKVG